MTTDLNMRTVLSLMDKTPIITEEVMIQLMEKFGDRTVDHIGGMKVHELAVEFQLADIPNPVKVAAEVLAFMREAEFVGAPTAAPQEPISVKVEWPEDITRMHLDKLLELLAANPDRFDEVYPYIEKNEMFREAMAKTENLAVTDKDGKLDAAATYKYIRELSRDGGRVRRMIDGRRTVSLEKSIGLEVRALIHPFTGDKVSGPDEHDLDYGLLSAELHKALIWARKTQHPFWPGSADIFTHGEEIFAETLIKRWQRIFDDYRHAVENEESEALAITRYWTEPAQEQVGSMGFVILTPQLTEEEYRAALYAIAKAPRTSSMGSIRCGVEVIRKVSASMGNIELDRTIVLEGVHASMGSIMGSTVYLPHGRSAKASMGSVLVDAYNKSWKELYELAQSYGLI